MRRLLPVVLSIVLTACGDAMGGGTPVQPSGDGPSRTFAVSGFTGVDVTGPDDVQVRTGAAFSVRAEGDPAALNQLRVARDGDALRIGRTPGVHWSGGRAATVFVTMPTIADAAVTGSGDLHVDRAAGDRFHAAAMGSGGLTVSALSVGQASLSMTGSGDMTLAGRALAVDASVTGSGGLDGARLAVGRAHVAVMGSGDVRLAVEGPADGTVTGSGGVDLGARARCSIRMTGSGEVRCGG